MTEGVENNIELRYPSQKKKQNKNCTKIKKKSKQTT